MGQWPLRTRTALLLLLAFDDAALAATMCISDESVCDGTFTGTSLCAHTCLHP